jgi:hypothetical protein
MMQEDLSLFLKAFARDPQRLLTTGRLEDLDNYQLTIANVWEMSFQAINRTNPTSAGLLLLLCFLNPAIVEDKLFAEASAGALSVASDPSAWKQLLLSAFTWPWYLWRFQVNWLVWYSKWILPQWLIPQCWLPQCWVLPVLALAVALCAYWRISNCLFVHRALDLAGYFVCMTYTSAVFKKWDDDYWGSLAKGRESSVHHRGPLFYLELGIFLVGIAMGMAEIIRENSEIWRQHFEIFRRRRTISVSASLIENVLVFLLTIIFMASLSLSIARTGLPSLRAQTPDMAFFSKSTFAIELISNYELEEDKKAHLETVDRFLEEQARYASSDPWVPLLRLILGTIRVFLGFAFALWAFIALFLWVYEMIRLRGGYQIPPWNQLFGRDDGSDPHTSDSVSTQQSSQPVPIIIPAISLVFAAVSYSMLRILWQFQDKASSFSRLLPESPRLLNNLLALSMTGEWDSQPYTQALAPLLNFGLLQRIPGRGYSIHALVQWWGREQLDVGQRQMWAMEGIRLVQYALQAEHSKTDLEVLRHMVNHLIETAGFLTSGDNYLYADMRELMVSLALIVGSIERLSRG